MSISSSVRKAGPFAGNDIQTVFAFAFKVFATTDVLAVSATGGVETTLTLGVDYTVALNPDQDSAPGGDLTLTAPLATGSTLAITSNVDALQSVTVTNGGGFFPAVFNGVFDKLTILVQQLAEVLGRSLRIPITASGVTSLTVPVLADSVLQWNADASALEARTLPDLASYLAFPPQPTHADQALFTDGSDVAWRAVVASVAGLHGAVTADALITALGLTTADITDYAADQAAIAAATAATIAAGITSATNAAIAATRAQAVAFAVAL